MEAWREELYHHGIQGQKWGNRRFQYENGRLTPAGILRYRKNGLNDDSNNDDLLTELRKRELREKIREEFLQKYSVMSGKHALRALPLNYKEKLEALYGKAGVSTDKDAIKTENSKAAREEMMNQSNYNKAVKGRINNDEASRGMTEKEKEQKRKEIRDNYLEQHLEKEKIGDRTYRITGNYNLPTNTMSEIEDLYKKAGVYERSNTSKSEKSRSTAEAKLKREDAHSNKVYDSVSEEERKEHEEEKARKEAIKEWENRLNPRKRKIIEGHEEGKPLNKREIPSNVKRKILVEKLKSSMTSYANDYYANMSDAEFARQNEPNQWGWNDKGFVDFLVKQGIDVTAASHGSKQDIEEFRKDMVYALQEAYSKRLKQSMDSSTNPLLVDGRKLTHSVIDELYHHGIKDQKWGVQNGPPYPLSRDQRTVEEKRSNGAESQSAKEKYGDNNRSSSGKKSVSSMSNAELQAAINRTNNEIRYKQLLADKNISQPKESKVLREGIGVMKNATSIAGNISRLVDKEDLGTALAGVSKAFGGASSAVDAIDKLAKRSYERKVAEFKANIDLSHISDKELADAVNRLSSEIQYEKLLNDNAMVDAGKERIYNILQTSNAALQIGSSATNIAAGIKQTVKAVKTDKSSKDDANKEESKKEESKKEKTKTESKKEQKQKTESKSEERKGA